MNQFTQFNPTKLFFGKDSISNLGEEVKLKGNRALILIGKGSVKHNGILKQVTNALKTESIEYTIFEGIKSNPEYQTADDAVKMAKDFNADCIVAVGGGSVIDTAKAVAAGFYVDHSVWDFFTKKAEVPNALPVYAVLTLAATGTEMNRSTVLQDTVAQRKIGWGNEKLFPVAAFLNPEFTYSVPADYTAYGVSDLIAHTLELFFGKDEALLSDYFATDVIKLAFEFGPKVLAEPNNYQYRAEIMWLATVALNGTLQAGKRSGDWGVHGFEHCLSVLYDVAHGAGLSIVYPAWLKHYYPQIEAKLDFMAKRVLGDDKNGKDFIEALENFYDKIGSPKRMGDIKVPTSDKERIKRCLIQNRIRGVYFNQTEQDYNEMLNLMW